MGEGGGREIGQWKWEGSSKQELMGEGEEVIWFQGPRLIKYIAYFILTNIFVKREMKVNTSVIGSNVIS